MSVFFASMGKRVLLVDCDSQGNLSGIFKTKGSPGLYELMNGISPDPITCRDNLDILPGDIRLSSLEEKLFENEDYSDLGVFLNVYEDDYDYCFIDTGPSLGALTLNALMAADNLILIVTPQIFTLEGTSDCVKTIVEMWSNLGGEAKLSAVILNRYDSRPILYRTVKAELDEHFSDTILSSSLGQSVKYEESIQRGIGIADMDEESKQKEEILILGKELLSCLDS